MGKFFDSIPPEMLAWIQKQQCFWVATAPLKATGHVNVSPKGAPDCFRIIDNSTVWYEDLSGSGCETIAHIRENGRVTIMFMAFEGAPRILRLFGTGTVHEFDTPEYNALIPAESRNPGSRAVIMINIYKVGTSCGYAVPYYEFLGHRELLHSMATRKENFDCAAPAPTYHHDKGLKIYWEGHNAKSLDGLPALLNAGKSSVAFNSSDNWRARTVDAKSVKNLSLKKEQGSVETRKREEWKLVGAFSAGVLVTAVCMKYIGSRA
ncbi:hypothetical protein JAAARDRAFT_118114 [Jaapia argillacea MUCL 33604]|uniref:Pyridoxamine 5'-phosphate oxidase N-terminal domain-containing protein n=1 Tax=Jaapia argillacea MUCL 33604 TaxID=933084 RepID=A0A067QKX5_9AGAM|nr:hypothetical protein JAAARDRAFT_118114 [Jaapia argillacea MUCL 33604]